MSTGALMLLVLLEVMGLIGLFVWTRAQARRREAGKARPSRPIRIAVALLGLVVVVGAPVLMIIGMLNPVMQSERERERLIQTGTPAVATINRIEETGSVYNHRPEVRVWMTVQPPGAPMFASQATWVFSVSDVQSYRVGTKVRVFFDPKDHGTVAVVGVAPPGR